MFSATQLPRVLLALVMSGKEINCYEEVVLAILQQSDKLESNGTFQTIVALSKQTIELNSIPNDLFYTLYLNVVKYIEEYNVYDLSQILNLFSHPAVIDKIPESFWDQVMLKALETAFENYEIYGKQKDVLNKPAYLYDLINCLVGFSFGVKSNPKEFWD